MACHSIILHSLLYSQSSPCSALLTIAAAHHSSLAASQKVASSVARNNRTTARPAPQPVQHHQHPPSKVVQEPPKHPTASATPAPPCAPSPASPSSLSSASTADAIASPAHEPMPQQRDLPRLRTSMQRSMVQRSPSAEILAALAASSGDAAPAMHAAPSNQQQPQLHAAPFALAGSMATHSAASFDAAPEQSSPAHRQPLHETHSKRGFPQPVAATAVAAAKHNAQHGATPFKVMSGATHLFGGEDGEACSCCLLVAVLGLLDRPLPHS
jgi:hypothetical protein